MNALVGNVRTLSAFVFAGALLAIPSRGYAHPLLDEARRAFGQADFEAALEAYARAEQADDLTRDDLVQLYLGRALVLHTVGDTESLALDLFRLATLDPDHEFGREVPPMIREAFARVKEANQVSGPIRVEITATRAPEGIRVEARVEGDLAAIVQAVSVGVRAPGNVWTRRTNAPLELSVTEDQTVEYYAEARGPGGALVASRGTPDDPLSNVVLTLIEPDAHDAHAGGPGDGGGGSDAVPSTGIPLWPFLVGGAVMVIAGGVLAAVLLGGGNDATDLNCCSLEGP